MSSESQIVQRRNLFFLKRVSARIHAISRDLVHPLGITAQQGNALLIIKDNKDISQAKLVRLLESDPNTVSAMVRRLEVHGLVQREVAKADGRSTSLSLTADGQQCAEKVEKAFDGLASLINDTIPINGSDLIARWLRDLLAIHANEIAQ